MDGIRKYLLFIVPLVVVGVVVFVSRKIGKNNENDSKRLSILEKAREAKQAKQILKNSENESSETSTD
jgi:hypothetical protein